MIFRIVFDTKATLCYSERAAVAALEDGYPVDVWVGADGKAKADRDEGWEPYS